MMKDGGTTNISQARDELPSQLQSQSINQLIQEGKQISPPLISESFTTTNLHSSINSPMGTTSVAAIPESAGLELQNVPLSTPGMPNFPTQVQTVHNLPQDHHTHETLGIGTQSTMGIPNIGNHGMPAQDTSDISTQYRRQQVAHPYVVPPLVAHWFYLKGRSVWTPFSFSDSRNLEAAYSQGGSKIVATDGGRYDVDMGTSTRHAVYWKEESCIVQRCTWFYKGDGESKLIPYDCEVAQIIENEYQKVAATSSWNHRLQLPSGDFVQIHNANIIVHFKQLGGDVDWTGEDSQRRPYIVRRGIADIKDEIPEGEPDEVDHLVFVVHGIGPVADLKFRPLEDCVDDMRQIALNLMNTPAFERATFSGRVEFLPVKWYGSVHDDKTGVDRQLKSISLSSAGKLRQFTNDTLTDILFFSSPMYCQAISDTVVNEMNRLLSLFKTRNPNFKGNVSVCGHSLGTCILFDILAHQGNKQDPGDDEFEEDEVVEEPVDTTSQILQSEPINDLTVSSTLDSGRETDAADGDEKQLPDIETVLKKLGLANLSGKFQEEQIDTDTLMLCTEADIKDLGIPMGPRKKLLSFVREQLAEQNRRKSASKPVKEKSNTNLAAAKPKPLTTKGTQTLLSLRRHNSDPNSVEIPYFRGTAGTGQPCVIYSKLSFEPYHMFALGSPVGLFLTTRGIQCHSIGLEFSLPTCKNFFNIFHPYDPVAYRLEPLVNPEATFPPVLIPHHKGRKRFHLEIKENLTRVSANLKQGFIEAVRNTWTSINEFARAHRSDAALEVGEETTEASALPIPTTTEPNPEGTEATDDGQTSPVKMICLGKLNSGRRIDFVLQEKPIEIINEYLFALSSHTCYWTSEDTVLLMMKEIYNLSPLIEEE